MDVIKTLTAGAPGTKRYCKHYGDKLVCVRYREDRETQRRLTTVEIVVDQAPLRPKRHTAEKMAFPHPNQYILVRVGYREEELRRRVKDASGRWVPDERLWRLPYRAVKALKLAPRVVRPAS